MAKNAKGQNNTTVKPKHTAVKPQQAQAAYKAEKKHRTLTISPLAANISCAVALAVFVGIAAWLLVGRNSDLLYHAQNLSFFNDTMLFFNQCMEFPAGLITWGSSFLTQFFYHPALGASIIIAMWVAVYFAAKKALRVSSLWSGVLLVPCFALLASTVDNEYWIYYLKQQGFWFSATSGFLVSMLLTWMAQVGKSTLCRAAALVVIAATYPLFGYYSLLALIYSGCMFFVGRLHFGERTHNPLILAGLAVLLLIAVPLTAYQFYANTRLIDMWIAGYALYVADTVTSMPPQVPFIILAVSPLPLALLPKAKEAKGTVARVCVAVNVAVVALCAYVVEKVDFQEYNYHAEMRMFRAMENREWNVVLDELGKLPGDANRQMVMFKNISLLNTGEMGTKMFAYNNKGYNPKNDYDTLHVHMVQTGASMIYYNHAKTNFAIRWCIENGVEYGPKICNLKLLALCSIVNSEWDAARKYLTILQHTMYHREWADHYMPLVDNPALIGKYHEFDLIRNMYDAMGTVLDGDQGLCEMYLLNYFANTMNKDSKPLQELTLNYAMIQKDIQAFWPRFFLYADLHQDESMPIHYQEAALLYGNLEKKVNISRMPFDKEKVLNRYASFQQVSQSFLSQGMSTPDVGEAMKPAFGDTFYWFYFFCRDVNSY